MSKQYRVEFETCDRGPIHPITKHNVSEFGKDFGNPILEEVLDSESMKKFLNKLGEKNMTVAELYEAVRDVADSEDFSNSVIYNNLWNLINVLRLVPVKYFNKILTGKERDLYAEV